MRWTWSLCGIGLCLAWTCNPAHSADPVVPFMLAQNQTPGPNIAQPGPEQTAPEGTLTPPTGPLTPPPGMPMQPPFIAPEAQQLQQPPLEPPANSFGSPPGAGAELSNMRYYPPMIGAPLAINVARLQSFTQPALLSFTGQYARTYSLPAIQSVIPGVGLQFEFSNPFGNQNGPTVRVRTQGQPPGHFTNPIFNAAGNLIAATFVPEAPRFGVPTPNPTGQFLSASMASLTTASVLSRIPFVGYGAFKIAENESPLPQDRLFAYHNYFGMRGTVDSIITNVIPTVIINNFPPPPPTAAFARDPVTGLAPALQPHLADPNSNAAGISNATSFVQINSPSNVTATIGGAITAPQQMLNLKPKFNLDVNREVIGFEKSFFCGLASVGLRLPFFQLNGTMLNEGVLTQGVPGTIAPPGTFAMPTGSVNGVDGDPNAIILPASEVDADISRSGNTFFFTPAQVNDTNYTFPVNLPNQITFTAPTGSFQDSLSNGSLSTFFANSDRIRTSDMGDVSFVFKIAPFRNPVTGSGVSGGVVLTLPTGPKMFGLDGKNINTTLFQPFTGWVMNMGSFYFHGFVGVAIPQEDVIPAILSTDFGIGFWLFDDGSGRAEYYRNVYDRTAYGHQRPSYIADLRPSPFWWLQNIIPTVELHWDQPFNDNTGRDAGITIPNTVIMIGGVHFVFNNTATLTVSGGGPVNGPRQYTNILNAALNFRF